jgi:phosphopantetheine--protein transferase-like protein
MTPAGLGIDVVDLLRGQGRAVPSRRFVDRVYAPEERAWLAVHPGRTDLPWILWAAKEAAFKAVTVHRGAAPVFTHADFRVELDELPDRGDAPGGALRGRVHWHDLDLPLGGSLTRERVVAWAVTDPGLVTLWRWARVADEHARLGGPPLEVLSADHLNPREAAPVHSLPSALVRVALRTEAGRWLDDDDGLEVVCPPGEPGRVPPELHRHGRRVPGVSVSISHHGDWLAWGLCAQRSGGR